MECLPMVAESYPETKRRDLKTLIASAPSHITRDMTVRQVAVAWPACAELLERYPRARWDGRWTLQELAPFARSCGIEESELLNGLAAAARVPIVRRIEP